MFCGFIEGKKEEKKYFYLGREGSLWWDLIS